MVSLARYRVFGKVGLNLLFTLALAASGIILILEGHLTWSQNITNISLHALFGILAMMVGTITVMRVRRVPHLSNIFLYSAFLFLGLLHLVGAIFQMYHIAIPGSMRPLNLLVIDLLEITLFLSLLSLAILAHLWWDRPVNPEFTSIYGLGFIGGALAVFASMYFISPYFPPGLLLILTMLLTNLSLGFIVLSVYSIFRSNDLRAQFNQLWMITAVCQYALAFFFILASIVLTIPIWIISIMCMTFGLISFILAVSIPELRHIGMEKTHASLYTFILAIFAFSPFFAAFVLEQLTPSGFVNYQLYVTIRLGTVIISLGIAVLLLIYSRQKKTHNLIPLLLAFILWAIIEAVLLIDGPYTAIVHELALPYIFGYLVAFFLLGMSVYRKQRPPKQKMEQIPWGTIIISIVGILSALGISMVVNQYVKTVYPTISLMPIDSTILLSLSFVNIFLFTILGYLYIRDARGQITIELLGMSFLMLWIIPGILKAIFPMWEMGWWAAEILLLGGLLVAPIVFGVAYLRTLRVTEESEKRAQLYSDILAHDISNYHQAMLTSLEILELPELPDEMEKEAIMQIHLSLRRADHLIKNVRQLGKIEHMPKTVLEPMDLVATINLAADQVFKALRAEDIIYHINEPEGKCFVDANPLLIDLFQNLLRNAVEYSDGEKRVDVEIASYVNNGQGYYRILIIDYGRGIPPDRKKHLFNRYMDGAFGSGIGLSVVRALAEAFEGWVEVQDRVPNKYEKGTIFIVTLPGSAN